MLTHEFIALAAEDLSQDLSYAILKKNKSIKIADEFILKYYFDFMNGFWARWDGYDYPMVGLNYHGITIISSEHLPGFIDLLTRFRYDRNINKLLELCKKALLQNKCIIHFGI